MLRKRKIIAMDLTFHVLVPDITSLFHASFSHRKNRLCFVDYTRSTVDWSFGPHVQHSGPV